MKQNKLQEEYHRIKNVYTTYISDERFYKQWSVVYAKMGFEQVVNKKGTIYIYFFDDFYRSQYSTYKTS